MNLNKAILIGRTTKKPELRSMPSGSKVCSFSLATSYKYKDKSGQEVDQTEFHNIVVFGKVAEVIAQYVVKGQELCVEGRIKTDKYEKDGKAMYSTKIILEKFQFGSKPKEYELASESASVSTPVAEVEEEKKEDDIDSLPF